MMAVVWVVVGALIWAYAILFWYRLHVVFPLDSKVIAASTFICPLFALCFSSVAITTVQRPAESIYGHTIPYQVLILGINI